MIIICRETLSVKAAKGIVRETRPIIARQIMQRAASAHSSTATEIIIIAVSRFWSFFTGPARHIIVMQVQPHKHKY